MTAGGIAFARQHADIVEQVQACAPPVTAPYLQDAYDRMKLGINARYFRANSMLRESFFQITPRDTGSTICETATEATAAYFDLVAILTSSPATASPAVPPCEQEPGTAGVDPASTSALSSQSAGSTADGAVPPDRHAVPAAGPIIPGSAASILGAA